MFRCRTRALCHLPLAAVVVGVGVVCGGCTPGPTDVFERFYAASARRDVVAFRATLCPATQGRLATVDDSALRGSLMMSRVIKELRVVRNDGRVADVEITDATGQQETAQVHNVDGRWCIEIPAALANAPAPGAP
jgi:hypothetical protein